MGETGLSLGQTEALTSSIKSDLTLYQFSRDRVEAGDAKDFLSRFGRSSLPTGKKLEASRWQSIEPLAHVAGFHRDEDLQTTHEAKHEVGSGEGLDKPRCQHRLKLISHLHGRTTRAGARAKPRWAQPAPRPAQSARAGGHWTSRSRDFFVNLWLCSQFQKVFLGMPAILAKAEEESPLLRYSATASARASAELRIRPRTIAAASKLGWMARGRSAVRRVLSWE